MIVVADTSVLINLCRIQLDHLLVDLFGEVWIPPTVEMEFSRLVGREPRFYGLALPVWVRRSEAMQVPPEVAAWPNLHPGESEALALALQLHADYLLVDDQAARAAAIAFGQRFTGVAGVLLRAKASGLINAVAPWLARLEAEGKFWIGEAFRLEVLRLAGEAP